ncbi:general secretion pathway protein GspD [Photorhabdus khanii]|uniref:General secretion pathway protein GspD n=1 Tax=Photorhabdus khanii TaxID=1004150 RepID=A0A7C9GHU0_9GAMM|nr:secretin N-terminal domain-containing protein [Photorhabdus khanii]MQL47276.1 general secretion pathway protein GspD [Photorhabdus khanii]MQL47286.1 general secretion pathway protein GspD [Photorhabdus khanii]
MKKLLASFFFLFHISAWAIPVELNNAPMRDFVSWYSKITGKSVIISPEVKGNVTVYSADVTKDELTPFFISVLRANGFDLTPGNPAVVAKLTKRAHFSDAEIGLLDSDSLPVPSGDFFNTSQPANLITKTYKINHVRAQDLAPVVDVFLKAEQVSGVTVFPFDRANMMAVTATGSQHKQLQSFLPDIDVSTTQVLIESIMFETTEGDSFDFSFAAGDAKGSPVAGGVNTDRLTSVLSSTGGSFGIFNGNILALSLKAIQSDSHAKLLSTPRIVTMSGKKGYISVGQNVPFITGKVTGEAANVTNPFQTIERHDVGVSLSVTPVVTPSGLVIMSVQSRADSISSLTTASDIITNQRQIDTTVQLKSGQTLLLGGLIDDRSTSVESSVPILSRIPLIGRLFTSSSDSQDKRTLYVLIRARVINAL